MKKRIKRSKVILRKKLNTILAVSALIISTVALIYSVRAKDAADWVDSKQNNVIEKILFHDEIINDSNVVVE